MTEPRAKNAHIWQRDPLDFYVETEEAVASLFDAVRFVGDIWDPACGTGTIPKIAAARGFYVYASDIAGRRDNAPDWPCPVATSDFLTESYIPHGARASIVCNPPFSRAEAFIHRALALADHHVAMLLPIKFLASQRRRKLFAETPVSQVLILSKRPSMPPGAVLAAGGKRGGGKEDFCWIVWLRGHGGPPQIGWLA